MSKSTETQAWNNYLRIRDHLLELSLFETERSRYWEEETSSLDYLVEASPILISKLRDHTHWLTGIRSYEYKNHHEHRSQMLFPRYEALRRLDSNLSFYGDFGILGDYGFTYDCNMVNIDTLKYFESVMALNLSGQLSRLRNIEKPIIVEIGAGWGGFLCMLKNYVRTSQLVVVDLPHTLIFSATYLPTVYPDLSVGFFGDSQFKGDEDLIFMTADQFKSWNPDRIDLAINMVSFQEMSASQVSTYSELLLAKGCSVLYSHNRPKSPHNTELKSVEDCLTAWPSTQSIKLLDFDYTSLPFTDPSLRLKQTKLRLNKKLIIGKLLRFFISLTRGGVRKKVNWLVGYTFRPEIAKFLIKNNTKLRSTPGSNEYQHKLFFSNLDLKSHFKHL